MLAETACLFAGKALSHSVLLCIWFCHRHERLDWIQIKEYPRLRKTGPISTPPISRCKHYQSWLVSARHRLTWCDVLFRLLVVDELFELCFLPPSGQPETVWRDGSNGDRMSSPWAIGGRSSPLWRQTADCGVWLRGRRSETAVLQSRASSTAAVVVDFTALFSSSSSSSWVVSSRCLSLTGDSADDSSCSSSVLARLNLVRRFWNQTFTCKFQSRTVSEHQQFYRPNIHGSLLNY